MVRLYILVSDFSSQTNQQSEEKKYLTKFPLTPNCVFRLESPHFPSKNKRFCINSLHFMQAVQNSLNDAHKIGMGSVLYYSKVFFQFLIFPMLYAGRSLNYYMFFTKKYRSNKRTKCLRTHNTTCKVNKNFENKSLDISIFDMINK